MIKYLIENMNRFGRVLESSLKVKNYEPLFNSKIYLTDDFKLLGLKFPSSRMIIEEQKSTIMIKKSNEKIKKSFTETEKIIGLNFPDSRFK